MSTTPAEILSLSEPVQRWLMESDTLPSCGNCLFFRGPGLTCTAFPEGIPPVILSGEQQHLLPVEGDNGIRWQPAEDPASGMKGYVKPYEREGHPVAGYVRADVSHLERIGERTGVPEIDRAIEDFGKQKEYADDYFGEDVPVRALRSPVEAAGLCSSVGRSFAKFLEQRGITAYDSGADVYAPNYPHPRNPLLGTDFGPDAFGYHDRTLHGDPDYPEHSATVVEHDRDIFIVDWAAAQYGYKEFPLVQRVALEGSKTVVRPYVREGHPVAGYERTGEERLSLENLISVAEQTMDRAGQVGRHWTVPDGRYDDPKVMAANRKMSEFASQVYDDNGGPQAINAAEFPHALSVKVQASHWMQHENPGAHGAANIYTNSIDVQHATNDMTLLHETAHLITKEHGHSPEFAALCRALYAKYISPEAADTYWGIVGFRLDPERAAKEAVAVRPYIREGHPVVGYTRHQTLKHVLDELRERFGRPLSLPGVELRQAKTSADGDRYAIQTAEITDKLDKMEPGATVEIRQPDVRMLELGPESTGLVSGLVGVYEKRDDGRWYKQQKTMRAGDREWVDSYTGISRVPDESGRIPAPIEREALGDADFASQYRGALLAPLGIADFVWQPPSDDEIAAWLNKQRPVGKQVTVNNDSLKRWPHNGDRGIYYHGDDGWNYYPSYADMYTTRVGTTFIEPHPDKPGKYVYTTAGIVNAMRQRFMDEMHDAHNRAGYAAEIRAWNAAVANAVNTDDYEKDGGSPGDLYRRQHEIIMEAGSALDQELGQAITEADLPKQEEIDKADQDLKDARGELNLATGEQRRMAEDIVRRVAEERLKLLKLPVWGPLSTGFLSMGNPKAASPENTWGVAHMDFLGGRIGAWLKEAVATERRIGGDNPKYPDGKNHWMVKLMRDDPVEYNKRTLQFVQEIADIANPRIAAEADIKNLVEPIARAKENIYEADAELGYLRSALAKRTEIVREIVGQHRKLGGELKTQNKKMTPGIKQVLEAAKYVPTDWIGSANQQDRWPKIKTQRSKRAHYNWDGTIQTNGKMGTSLHELVHYLEHTNRPIDAAEWTFWNKRGRGGDFDGDLEELVWVGGGKKSEKGIRDKFGHAYAGKTYGGPGQHWELLTMGIPALYGLSNPDLVWRDDEYRRFVLGSMVLL